MKEMLKIYYMTVRMRHEKVVEVEIEVNGTIFSGYISNDIFKKFNVKPRGMFRMYVKSDKGQTFLNSVDAQKALISDLKPYINTVYSIN